MKAPERDIRQGEESPVVSTKTAVREPTVRIDDDFYRWLHDQAFTLRRLRPNSLDWQNLAEELETMGRSEESSLESYLVVLLKHLLKWRYQANQRTGSWEASIENARDRIDLLLRRSPSLRSKIDEVFGVAYRLARRKAGAQMGLSKRQWESALPGSSEWPLDKVLAAEFWPDAASPSPSTD
jgi:hypothetical protein